MSSVRFSCWSDIGRAVEGVRILSLVLVAAGVALALSAGCSSGGDGTPTASVNAVPGEAWEVSLGEAVVSGDAGSVGQDTKIILKKVSDVAGAVGAEGAGAAYLLTTDPPNTTFLLPVTITLPYTESVLTDLGLTSDDLVILKQDPDSGGTIVITEGLTPDPATGLVEFQVESFSTFEPAALLPAEVDATGKWIVCQFKNFASPSSEKDFVDLMLVDTAQDGNVVSVDVLEEGGQPAEEDPLVGFVSGSTYNLFVEMTESDGGVTYDLRTVIQFTAGAEAVTGTVRWYAFADDGGPARLIVSGGATLELTPAAEPTFDATGDWDYSLSDGETGTVAAEQTLDEGLGVTRFALTPDGGDPLLGYVAGDKYFAYAEYQDGDPPTFNVANLVKLTLSDEDTGAGTVYTSEEEVATEEVTETSLSISITRAVAPPP